MTDEEILATYKPTKSKRRCAFCTSRACYERVVTKDMIFDEVACNRHQPALYRLSDIHLPGVGKMFISSTGYMERGESVDFEEFKREVAELMRPDDKLPNYFDVTIEATLCEATTDGVRRRPYQLHVEDVEAVDGRSAVEQTLRSQHARWQDFTVEPGEGGEGWQFVGDEDDYDADDWLEFDLIDDYADFATAVPYERRLRLAGARPMEFVKNA